MNNYTTRAKVGIVGFRGYSGADLVRLLERHPHIDVYLLEHRQDAGDAPEPLGFTGPQRISSEPQAIADKGIAGVFLATPAQVSMELAPALVDRGIKVVDLSGAFRLATVENYARWYKEQHSAAALLSEAVYSIPEFHRAKVTGARLM